MAILVNQLHREFSFKRILFFKNMLAEEQISQDFRVDKKDVKN